MDFYVWHLAGAEELWSDDHRGYGWGYGRAGVCFGDGFGWGGDSYGDGHDGHDGYGGGGDSYGNGHDYDY